MIYTKEELMNLQEFDGIKIISSVNIASISNATLRRANDAIRSSMEHFKKNYDSGEIPKYVSVHFEDNGKIEEALLCPFLLYKKVIDILAEDFINNLRDIWFTVHPENNECNIVTFEELNTFVKFCNNKIDYDLFLLLMKKIYPNSDNYIKKLWPYFQESPVEFITDRGDKILLFAINDMIKKSNYHG